MAQIARRPVSFNWYLSPFKLIGLELNVFTYVSANNHTCPCEAGRLTLLQSRETCYEVRISVDDSPWRRSRLAALLRLHRNQESLIERTCRMHPSKRCVSPLESRLPLHQQVVRLVLRRELQIVATVRLIVLVLHHHAVVAGLQAHKLVVLTLAYQRLLVEAIFV